MPAETERRTCETPSTEHDSPIELTPSRRRNFARVYDIVSGVVSPEGVVSAEDNADALPEPTSYQPVMEELKQAWHWNGSIRSEVSASLVMLCTTLDLNDDSVFSTRIESKVVEIGKENPLIWKPDPFLDQSWNFNVLDTDRTYSTQFAQTIREGIITARYDLEDADAIIKQLRKHPEKAWRPEVKLVFPS